MIVWRSEGITGMPLSGPPFSAYTILAKPYSQTKAWSVCRFVLLSEKPSSQHTLGMGGDLSWALTLLCPVSVKAMQEVWEKLTREDLGK